MGTNKENWDEVVELLKVVCMLCEALNNLVVVFETQPHTKNDKLLRLIKEAWELSMTARARLSQTLCPSRGVSYGALIQGALFEKHQRKVK